MPAVVRAESNTVWSFLGSQVGPEWRINGKARTTAEIGGLHMIPEEDVRIFRLSQFPHRVDAVEITYLSLQDTPATLLWHRPGDEATEVVQLPFLFTKTTVAETVKLDVRWYDAWVAYPDVVGLSLPKGADIQLLQITFTGLTMRKRLSHLLRSYWHFDAFTPYSINFLWGPVFTPSAIAREKLFTDLPPHGRFANTVWYALLLLTAAGCGIWAWKPVHRRSALWTMTIVLSALWILSDLRMGLEIVSYARADLVQWSTPPDRREFRERGDFPVFLSIIQPLLAERGRYVFLTQYEYPLLGLMRYHAFPSQPVPPEQAAEGVDTWVIYERPEIVVDAENRLSVDGNPLSAPGDVLFEFRPGAFVFRTH